MSLPICWLISHAKDAKQIDQEEFKNNIECYFDEIGRYSFITQVIKSDLLQIIKQKLIYAMIALTLHPEEYAQQFDIVLNLSTILFSIILQIETEDIEMTRIRPIILKMGIINILNTIIEISNIQYEGFLASYIVYFVSNILPCINTRESIRFFRSKYGGIQTKHIVKTCQMYLQQTIIQMKKDKVVTNWNNDSSDLNVIGWEIVTISTHLLAIKKYRKKVFQKKLHRNIPLLFIQILEVFFNIFIKRFGEKLNTDYFHNLLLEKNNHQRMKVGDELFEVKPLNYLFPILKACLQFIFILSNYFDIKLLYFFSKDNPNKTKCDFEFYWNYIGQYCFALIYMLTGDTDVSYWHHIIDIVVNGVTANNKQYPNEMIPKILTQIENNQYFIPDKCFYSKCSKSSTKINLKRCCKCLSAFYCGKKCQKRDWVNHKQYCRKW